MRKIKVKEIEKKVCEAALKANFNLRGDVLSALKKAVKTETKLVAKKMLKILIENACIARCQKIAICQDTGMVVVFCQIGNKVQIIGDVSKAINNGIKAAYKQGCLRKSVVDDPLVRKNTNTNTPAVIHYDIISGDKIKISVMPKGFGSENKTKLKMFNPTVGIGEIKKFIVEVVKCAGADACPPYIIGVGIGGTADYACLLAKKALLEPTAHSPQPTAHSSKLTAKLQKDLLTEINRLNIGPMGLGGRTTCLGVNILTYPTHIAGLPVCVNVCCHALRSAEVII
ncbi:MAG: fumarate hydratase [Candidatus Omnitrophota bacterium]